MISRLRVAAVILFFFLSATTLFFGRSYIKPVENDEPLNVEPDTADVELHTEKTEYQAKSGAEDGCTKSPEWLKELVGSPDFKVPFRYARRDIIIEEDPGSERLSVTKLDDQLLPNFQEVKSLEEPELAKKQCLPPLSLRVPSFPKQIDASHILFGAATTVERLDATISYFQRWLANTGARLVVDVNGNDGKEPDRTAMRKLEARMRALGMLVTLTPTPDSKANNVQRYFSLIKTLHKHKDESTQWVSFIDDDTFITSMPSLLARLAEHDSQKSWYIGNVSEEWWTVCAYGWVAMGGGGIFLSLPLLEILNTHWSDCTKKAIRGFGDHQIAECIERHTDVHLTTFDGLYQIDIHGDRSGVFESGRPMLSQHHWKEGYWSEDGSGFDTIRHPRWFPIDAMSLVSDVCGDNCFLQRWQFGKDTILSNGYSVAVYPKDRLKNLELFKMEKTWPTHKIIDNSLNTGFDHYLGPLRPALEFDTEKIQYRFMDAKVTHEGGVRQYYRHLGKNGELDSIIELHWMRRDTLSVPV